MDYSDSIFLLLTLICVGVVESACWAAVDARGIRVRTASVIDIPAVRAVMAGLLVGISVGAWALAFGPHLPSSPVECLAMTGGLCAMLTLTIWVGRIQPRLADTFYIIVFMSPVFVLMAEARSTG